jgi:hypothetical protein
LKHLYRIILKFYYLSDDGVIETDIPVISTKDPEVVLVASVLVVDTTCSTLPKPVAVPLSG